MFSKMLVRLTSYFSIVQAGLRNGLKSTILIK